MISKKCELYNLFGDVYNNYYDLPADFCSGKPHLQIKFKEMKLFANATNTKFTLEVIFATALLIVSVILFNSYHG